MKENKKSMKSLIVLCIVGMLSAVSFVLFLLEFPVIPALSHLKLDFSDVPALISGVIFGPVSAIAIELVKNLIELLVKGIGTQMGYGNLMNFLVGCAYVVPFSIVYCKMKKSGEKKGIILSCVAGTLTIIVVGFFANYLIAPLFFKHFLGITLDNAGIWTAVWGATAINAIKGVMLSVISLPVIKVLVDRLKKYVK
ncbi:MAG: ECF transporter S component [Clostridia bacterium]|nr:ECF transporter S component [Clostridia bacterium]